MEPVQMVLVVGWSWIITYPTIIMCHLVKTFALSLKQRIFVRYLSLESRYNLFNLPNYQNWVILENIFPYIWVSSETCRRVQSFPLMDQISVVTFCLVTISYWPALLICGVVNSLVVFHFVRCSNYQKEWIYSRKLFLLLRLNNACKSLIKFVRVEFSASIAFCT